jgi:pilus assembly protein CpaB
MRMVFGLVLVVGLALAGAAVYLTQNYFKQTQAALNHEREMRAKIGPMIEVYVVNKPKKYGDTLTKDDVQLIYWPENAMPETIFKDPRALEDGEAILFPEDNLEPRFVLRQMEKFEPILAEKVTEPGETAGLTGQLGKGQGAFAIKVDVASGVSGFVQPGDFVDVYWTGAAGENSDNMTRLIETSLKVIAVDQKADDGSGGASVARTVTVAAVREQVARLAQAAATGKLALSLVSGVDTGDAMVEVDSNSLLGITEAPEEVVTVTEPDKVCYIKTRKGGELVDSNIPTACTN